MTAPGFTPAPLTMTEAPARLIAAALERAGREGPAVIGVTGPVGAGKSTLAKALSVCVLSTDDYLPDYDLVPYNERDLPERMDTQLLIENLMDLRRGRPARVPVWSFQTHRREGYRQVLPSATVVCEGIHALHGPVAGSLDLRVFIDARAEVRWRRWEHLEVTGVRGWGVERARVFFNEVAEPTFALRAPGYRAAADFVVINDG